MRIFAYDVSLITYQTCRQNLRQFTTLGLLHQRGVKAVADCVKLQLRDLPFQTEDQATVDRAGIIDAIAVGDEATPEAADIQQRIPVSAITSQAGHFVGEDNADLIRADTCDQFLESRASHDGPRRLSEVGINHLDMRWGPAELFRTLPQGVLQTQALLMGEHLIGAGLADVNDRLAGQVMRL